VPTAALRAIVKAAPTTKEAISILDGIRDLIVLKYRIVLLTKDSGAISNRGKVHPWEAPVATVSDQGTRREHSHS
jgi:hypothetical protein